MQLATLETRGHKCKIFSGNLYFTETNSLQNDSFFYVQEEITVEIQIDF